MPLSLHAATVPTWLQITAATKTLIDKAEAWCEANGESPEALLHAKLAENMWSLDWQVHAVWMQSAHALAAAKSGTFEPIFEDIPNSFEACRAKLDKARDAMLAANPDDLDACAENNLDFVLGGTVRMSFTVQNFLLSFTNPNFFFHAATAYDILRMKGVEVGKRDFLGAPAIKG